MGFSKQEYWSGLPCPPPGDLPDPGIEPMSLTSPALAGGFFTVGTTRSPASHVYTWIVHLGSSCFSFWKVKSAGVETTWSFPFQGQRGLLWRVGPGSWLLSSLLQVAESSLLWDTCSLWLSWSRYPKLANLKMYSEFSWDFLTRESHLSIPAGFQIWWNVCLQSAHLEESLLDREDSYDIF